MIYFISIFITTFILEDIAITSSIILISEHKISFEFAYAACFLGIALGDLGLYFIGYCLGRFHLEKKFKIFKNLEKAIVSIKKGNLLTYSIIIARIVPGTRMPTYLGAGFVFFPFLQFFIITVLTVIFWTLVAFWGGLSFYNMFINHWILGLLGILIFLAIIKYLFQAISNLWNLKSLLYSWRKCLYFEFWPSYIFYLPLVFYYLILSVKYKSIFMPFYANKNITNGGLIGESKWYFLNYLNPKENSTLKSILVEKSCKYTDIIEILNYNKISYPFIIKPDVGQRGFGVRKIHNEIELNEYLYKSNFDIIIQEYSKYKLEAGIFYVRKPSEKTGYIFSITDKIFPYIIGDGKSKFGKLILQEKRARIISSYYFSRFKGELDSIPNKDQIIYLTECGNHSQGAIFLNGNHIISNDLTNEVDRISKQIPNFYFGRFDIRYENHELLKLGKNFEIVEVNGAGAEATHIWDRKTKLLDAYKTLFKQWNMLFEVGKEAHLENKQISNLNIKLFLISFLKFIFRDKTFIVSS